MFGWGRNFGSEFINEKPSPSISFGLFHLHVASSQLVCYYYKQDVSKNRRPALDNLDNPVHQPGTPKCLGGATILAQNL
jgi:hypothetical protein